MESELDRRSVDTARLLALDVVQLHRHGHAGAAMGLAPLAHLLFQRVLRHDPERPDWEGRDRFVLSAGHASLLLYIQLYLTGYGLTLDDVRATRTLGSATPGHPEWGHTAGVEMTTGPLGQGVAASVGMAASIRHLAALAGPGSPYDQRVWCLASDGDLMEGIASEACSLAGTWGLGNLCVVWDDNGVSIDSDVAPSFTEDVRARFEAYGWRVESVDVTSDQLLATLESVAAETEQPTLVALRTEIGWPVPGVAGTSDAHAGPVDPTAARAAREKLGFPPDSSFLVPDDVLEHTRLAVPRGRELRERWEAQHRTWELDHPERARAIRRLRETPPAVPLVELCPPDDADQATRTVSGRALRTLHDHDPRWWGGAADLAASTSVGPIGGAFSADDPAGADLHFGVREHAMAGILNGIALHGWFRPYGATYLVFADYQRPALRLAALMRLPVLHIHTHDSLAVGEDGPTHQPVEQLAALRAVPNVAMVRPADHAEVVGAWQRLQDAPDGPACLVLSRQKVPNVPGTSWESVARGGYVVRSAAAPDAILIATGSELSLAVAAAERLGEDGLDVQVVSMPCTEWFVEQSTEYRDSVLPPSVRARVAVEAGATSPWWRWVGLEGEVVGVDSFGESGPGADVLVRHGINVDSVVEAVRRVTGAALLRSADVAHRPRSTRGSELG